MLVSMFGAALLTGVLQDAAPSGWRVAELKDEMTDAVTVVAVVETETARLTVGCDGRLYMRLTTVEYLGRGSAEVGRNLVFRVDDRPLYAQGGRWNYGPNQALNRNAIDDLVGRWAGGESVLVRAKTYDHRDVDERFGLEGAADAIAQVYAACGQQSPLPVG